jgi:IMP and pyridine-specific 5'-nucleotidase
MPTSKEEDPLIQLLLSRASAVGARRAFADLQGLLSEHCAEPAGSRLSAVCPGVGRVFRELDLARAFEDYDKTFFVSARRFVPLSFHEARQIFNLASVAAAATGGLRLVTLDADDTIYSDGGSLDPSSPMISLITRLLVRGVNVALVTAASYPGQPERFEARLAGLLSALAFAIECGAPAEPLLTRFKVMGGQCNVLLVPDLVDVGGVPKVLLREVEGEFWKRHRGVRWAPEDIKKLLDAAQHTFEEVSRSLQLQVTIIRKERAVGLISASGSPVAAGRLTYDVLEELTLAVQEELGNSGTTVPFCAFNGGHDAFVDVGNKALGVAALQSMVGATPSETLHIGDRCAYFLKPYPNRPNPPSLLNAPGSFHSYANR